MDTTSVVGVPMLELTVPYSVDAVPRLPASMLVVDAADVDDTAAVDEDTEAADVDTAAVDDVTEGADVDTAIVVVVAGDVVVVVPCCPSSPECV
jgi:hypothetical protein